MNLKQAFKMSMQSVTANKVRSFLTMLGIIIGVAAVMILVSIVQGGNQEMEEYYKSLGTNKIDIYAYRYNQVDLTEDIMRYCMTIPDLVEGFTPAGTAYTTVRYRTANTENNQDFGNPQVYLGNQDFAVCNNYTLDSGRDISYLDCQRYNKVVVLGSKLKEYLFQAQDPVGQQITIGGQRYEVIGTYASVGEGGSYSWSYDYMNYVAVVPYTCSRYLETYGPPSNFVAKATSPDTLNEAITRIGSYVAGLVPMGTGDYSVTTQQTWQEESQDANRLQSMILGGIAGISLLVGGIGIMNIMLVTVTERTREIGIRKAIGGSRRSIIVQFLIEASVLCGMGGVFGVVLGYLGTVIAGKLLLQMEEVLLPSAGLTAGALVFSALLGVGFGLYPAIKASGLQPVEALRAD